MKKDFFKKLLLCLGISCFVNVVIPLTCNALFLSDKIAQSMEDVNASINIDNNINKEEKLEFGEFKILDIETDEIITVSDSDFILGSLISEMSSLVPKEALKAQAVASYSYYSYLRNINKNQDYHFTYNSKNNLIYTDEENRKLKFADDYENQIKTYKEIVQSVMGEMLMYKDEIACTSFFKKSNGNTENAKDIIGEEIEYLTAVASPYDLLSGQDIKIYKFTPEEVQSILTENWKYGQFDFEMDYEDWFSDIVYTNSSSVVSIKICGFGITGYECSETFKLKSPSFAVKFNGTEFEIETKGSGALLGMSQTGASEMAIQGADYKEILSWYYPNTNIKKIY